MQVIEPIITYAAGIWGGATKFKIVKDKLISLQRGFAIKIIRAFKTVSASAAISLALLTPLHLKVIEVANIETSKLTGKTELLPDDIVIEKPLPQSQLLHPADRKTIEINMATTQEDIDKNYNNHTTKIFTDGSKHNDGSTGAAFVVQINDKIKIRKKYKLHPSCTVFQAELLAIERACKWVIQTGVNNLSILTDSLSGLKEIQNKDSTNAFVVSIHKCIHQICNAGTGTINFIWVKAHKGLTGNEEADSTAKQAASSHSKYEYDNTPLSYLKHNLKQITSTNADSYYKDSVQGQYTKSICPDLESIQNLWEAFKPSFEFTQILTGHGFNLSYLYRFKIKSTNKCPCNDNSEQTFKHLIEECPRYSNTRNDHIITCNSLNINEAFNIKKIISKESSVTYMLHQHIKTIVRTLKDFNRHIT
ncbi:unnamed protein product [Parnassius apollo]|uniref:(apollo) hypothetical protein n=1 Tax=Parnassius apollo TaxID=110799 RepID=A0A8S3X0B7_PARAO|nr:unnamed protein product [Parnassius apollo]